MHCTLKMTICSAVWLPYSRYIRMHPQSMSIKTEIWHVISGCQHFWGRLCLKCDGTCAETRFCISAKQKSLFKSAGGVKSVDYWQPRCVHQHSNAGWTMFRGSVKDTGFPLHSPVSPSHPIPYITMCHHVSAGLYHIHYLEDGCSRFLWNLGNNLHFCVVS